MFLIFYGLGLKVYLFVYGIFMCFFMIQQGFLVLWILWYFLLKNVNWGIIKLFVNSLLLLYVLVKWKI